MWKVTSDQKLKIRKNDRLQAIELCQFYHHQHDQQSTVLLRYAATAVTFLLIHINAHRDAT